MMQARSRRAQAADQFGDVVGRRAAARDDLVPGVDRDRLPLGALGRLHGDDQAQLGRGVGGRQQAFGERGCRDDRRGGARIGQDMAVIVGRVGRVGGHRHGAGGHDREVGDDPVGPVLRDQHDAVAARDAERAQAARQRRDLVGDGAPRLRPVRAAVLRPQEGCVAARQGAVEKHRRQIGPHLVAHHASHYLVAGQGGDINRHSPDDIQIRGNRTTAPSPRGLCSHCSHPMT